MDGSGSLWDVGVLRVHRTRGSGSPTTTQLTLTLSPAAATTCVLSWRSSVMMRLGQANCRGDRWLHCMPRSRWGASQAGLCRPALNSTVVAALRRSCSQRSRQSQSHGLLSTRNRLRMDGDGRYSTVAGLSCDRLLPARLRSARCRQPAKPLRSTWTSLHAVKSMDSMSGSPTNEYASTWTIALPRRLMMRSAGRWRNDLAGTDVRRLSARSSI